MTGRHVDIERHDELLRYLRDSGRIGPDERPEAAHARGRGLEPHRARPTAERRRVGAEAGAAKASRPGRVVLLTGADPARSTCAALARQARAYRHDHAPCLRGPRTPFAGDGGGAATARELEDDAALGAARPCSCTPVRPPAEHYPQECARTSGRDRARLRRPLVLRIPAARALLRVHGNARPRGSACSWPTWSKKRWLGATPSSTATTAPRTCSSATAGSFSSTTKSSHFGDPAFDLGFSLPTCSARRTTSRTSGQTSRAPPASTGRRTTATHSWSRALSATRSAACLPASPAAPRLNTSRTRARPATGRGLGLLTRPPRRLGGLVDQFLEAL